MSTFKKIALTCLAVTLPCFAWGEVLATWTDFSNPATQNDVTLNLNGNIGDASGVTIGATNGLVISFSSALTTANVAVLIDATIPNTITSEGNLLGYYANSQEATIKVNPTTPGFQTYWGTTERTQYSKKANVASLNDGEKRSFVMFYNAQSATGPLGTSIYCNRTLSGQDSGLMWTQDGQVKVVSKLLIGGDSNGANPLTGMIVHKIVVVKNVIPSQDNPKITNSEKYSPIYDFYFADSTFHKSLLVNYSSGVTDSVWQRFAKGQAAFGTTGATLRFTSDIKNASFNADYDPLTLTGLIVESGATGNSFTSSSTTSNRRTEFGNSGNLEQSSYFTVHEDFTFNRASNYDGNVTCYGQCYFEIDSEKTLAVTVSNDDYFVLAENSAIHLSNGGTLAVNGPMAINNNTTIDVSGGKLVVNGAVTIAEDAAVTVNVAEGAQVGDTVLACTNAEALANCESITLTRAGIVDADHVLKPNGAGTALLLSIATDAVCTDGTNYYTTLAAAVAAGATEIRLLDNVTVAEDLTVAASISGDFKLTVSAGTLTLTGTNTYTGGTEVAEGAAVNINKRAALGSGSISGAGTVKLTGFTTGINNTPAFTIAGVTLDLNNQYTWHASDGSGYLTQSPFVLSNGAQVINGAVTPYTGGNTALTIVEYTGGAPAIFAADVHSVYTNSARTRKVIVADGTGEEYDLEMSGDLGLPDGQFAATTLIKEGPGVLKLSGANNLPALTISEGTVLVANADALSATTTLAAGATLNLNGQTVTVATLAGAGAITGTGTITVTTESTFTGTIADGITVDAPGADSEIENALGYDLIWLPVGDSITEGEQYMGHPESGNANTRGGYRYQLWSKLENGGQGVRSVGFRTGHYGTTEAPETVKWAYHAALYGGDITAGSSGAQLFNVETTLEVAGYPDFISILLGINDLSRTGTDQHANHFAAWAQLIDRYAKLRPHSKVLAVTMLPVVGTNASADDFGPFNEMIRAAATNKTTPFDNDNVVLADIARLAFNDTFNADYFKTTDGLHPNESGSKLVADAFRTVIVEEVITPLNTAEPTIVNVNNATEGKIAVLFNKPIESTTATALTISGTDITDETVYIECTTPEIDGRVIYFTLPETTTLTAGTYTVMLNGTVTDTVGVTTSGIMVSASGSTVELYGSGAAENVPESFREGFVRRNTLEVTGTDNYGGSAPTMTVDNTDAITTISKAAYYVELQRPGKAPQFVWVSMDATAFDNSEAKASIPTTEQGNVKALVEDLAVYGNRGNFMKSITGEQGVVEFSPWGYGGAEESDYPTDMSTGVTGWNDTLATSTLFGSMQVARVRSERDTTKTAKYDPAAELLFAFNGFNTSEGTDLAIGSMSVHRNNAGNTVSGLPNYDWTRFYERTQYPDFNLASDEVYTVKKIELWVAPVAQTTGIWDELIADKVTDVTNQEAVETALDAIAAALGAPGDVDAVTTYLDKAYGGTVSEEVLTITTTDETRAFSVKYDLPLMADLPEVTVEATADEALTFTFDLGITIDDMAEKAKTLVKYSSSLTGGYTYDEDAMTVEITDEGKLKVKFKGVAPQGYIKIDSNAE